MKREAAAEALPVGIQRALALNLTLRCKTSMCVCVCVCVRVCVCACVRAGRLGVRTAVYVCLQ